MLGIAPGHVPPQPPPAATPDHRAALGNAGTMIGIQSPFAAAPETRPSPATATPPVEAPAPRLGLKQTMLGFAAPPGLADRPVPSREAPVPASATPTFQGTPNASPDPMGGTLAFAAPSVPRDDGRNQAFGSPTPAGIAPQAMHKQTMLGVARPGIAPLRAGEPRPAPEAAREPIRFAVPVSAPQPRQEPTRTPSLDDPPAAPVRAGLPKGAIVLIIVAALLAVTAGVVAFLWESPRPIRAEVVLDDRSNEVLSLSCDDCVDGTQVSLGPNKALFAAKKASLALSKPLEVGKNDIVVAVQRPGIGRDEEVALSVTVDYRVRGVLTSLAEDPPKVKVAVQAVPGSAVVVDGQPVQLDPTGKGEHSLDVSHDLDGPAETIQPFERKLPYTVTPPGAEARSGEVTLRFGIVPLRVDAPGDGIIVEGETFMLSGHTLKDGRITVSGRPITVDAEGRFAQLMNVSSIGETTVVVRAEAKDHAPRFVRVKVKRVAKLKDEAVLFRQSATDQYSAMDSADSKKGLAVALAGEVIEVRLDGEVTVLLFDVKKGCETSPCLAKVTFGGRFGTKKGANVTAFGHVVGSVDGPRTGTKIPAVAAEFLLVEKAK
jgi:hypothetical protein